jgi:hypothetical protein
MRALAAAVALSLVTAPALAASPQVEAAIKALEAIGADAKRLDRFCKVMEVVEGLQDRIDQLETEMANSLDQLLGADFKAAREAVRKIEEEAQESADAKALNAAMDQLSDKCPD